MFMKTWFVILSLYGIFGSFKAIAVTLQQNPKKITSSTNQKKRILLWLCLEFCEETSTQIESNLQQIEKHQDILTAISFEKYTLGPNSTLIDHQLTEVASTINSFQLEAWPLLSSYPHPSEFLDWMRQVFQQPDPFIESCITEAKKYQYIGYNLDWEPTENVTEQDGLDYATFIDYFAKQLAMVGLRLTVDIATWSVIWNYQAIAATTVETAISMGTYTSTDTTFTTQLNTLVSTFGPARSGVGLETVNATSGEPLPLDEVQWRFQQIEASHAIEVDIWSSPVPDGWWPFLRHFYHSSTD